MSKKSLLMIFAVIMTFSFCSNIKAVCYEKCVLPKTTNSICEYTTSCVSSGSISCEKADDQLCNGSEGTYENYSPALVSCGADPDTGEYLLTNIPTLFPKAVSIIYIIIQVAVPVVLTIFGILDLFKAVTAGKEDEMKKGQQLFIKRLITAAIIFFVFVFVKLIISFAADSDNSNRILDCAECFIKNNCKLQGVKI